MSTHHGKEKKLEQIAKRPLGSTGLDVSCLGLGTVKLGRSTGVKYPQPVKIPTDDEARELLKVAQELGINLIDTAPAYGQSEQRLGGLLAGQRDQWVIVTKVGEEFDGEKSTYDFSPAAILQSIEQSLRKLKTDCVDVVLVHSDGNIEEDLVRSGVVDALERAKLKGWCRAFGASTKTVAGGLHAVEHCDVVMVMLTPQYREEVCVIDAARAKGKGVLIKKALSSGHAMVGAPPRVLESQSGASQRHPSPQARGNDVHPLAFAIGVAGVTSVIVGTTNPEHLRDNVEAVNQT
jgi:aryl-alcohol dehydrogenase-like predicted oxidoreductase